MHKSVFFRDELIDIIEDYADENQITFNKAVNNIVEEHSKVEELKERITSLEAQLKKEKTLKEDILKRMTDRFDRIELLISNDSRTHIG